MRLPNARMERARLAAVAGVIGFLLAACDTDARQSALNPASEVARELDSLWDLTFALAVAVFVIVEGLLVFALIKFRRRPGREAAQFHGNPRIEIVLTLIPALILAGLSVPTIRTLFRISGEQPDALQMTVTGHQFWWEFQYDLDGDGEFDVETANEAHIPIDRPIFLTLLGDVENNDVIHSFWVPRLAGKQDTIPGQINHLQIMADEPGLYFGQCAEFCGLSHAKMRIRVYADEEEGFERWVDEQQEEFAGVDSLDGLARQGADLFVNGAREGAFEAGPACATCHTVKGLEGAVGQVGPNLTHLADRETIAAGILPLEPEPLARWIADPPDIKPGARMPDLGLTPEQIRALTAFLLELE